MHLFRLAVWTLSATMLLAASAQGATRTVCASGCMYTNLQPAIDAAQPGDTILLRAGETFIGNYVLKAKSGTAEIIIRSDAPATSLPAAGVRLVPSGRTGGNTSLSALARLRGQGGTYREHAGHPDSERRAPLPPPVPRDRRQEPGGLRDPHRARKQHDPDVDEPRTIRHHARSPLHPRRSRARTEALPRPRQRLHERPQQLLPGLQALRE